MSTPSPSRRPAPPVAEALPALLAALDAAGRAVLVAPPGAGKTTLVPLAIDDAAGATGRAVGAAGRILMLEPRRLAARAAAERMAALREEPVGRSVGYRMRGDVKSGPDVRIEVVTEGVLTRMLQTDPALDGVSTVIFDEFHERSLHADLGLALALEAQGALRADLRLLVMSATLDAGPVATLMGDAPVIRSEGRTHPVETRWLATPWRRGGAARMEPAAIDLIRAAHEEEGGDILVFLPGVGEIRRVAAGLSGLPATTEIRALYGAAAFGDQRAALAPAPAGRRKIVLATAIAETSLTVEGVRVVVDAGLARRARFDPGAGMGRLVTERASKAEADQRRGRAGRLAPGVCLRLWTRAEEGALAPFAPAEIETADLAPLALELAAWGAEPGDLNFLTPPPRASLDAARALLAMLGALDRDGRITAAGRAMAEIPAHPRLAHMISAAAGAERGVAVSLAALLESRDPMSGGGADIGLRLRALGAPSGPAEGALRRIADDARRLARRTGCKASFSAGSAGALIASAYPDRIAMRRKGGEPRYLLSGGKGARMRADDALAGAPFLAVASLDGDAREALIRIAAPLTLSGIRELFGDRMIWRETCEWSRRSRRVEARRRLTLGALSLEDHAWPDAPADAVAAAMIDGVRDLGLTSLPWSTAAKRLTARAEWARQRGAEAPAMTEDALLEAIGEWLSPYLSGAVAAADLARVDLMAALRARLGWAGAKAVDEAAPETFAAPTGTTCRIDYGGARASIAVRLQELFSLDRHPMAGGEPLTIELLSPAGRPVQTTADLPGFWRTSYADVRKDMRGRYPRHPWPEDPLAAAPTRRVKPRTR